MTEEAKPTYRTRLDAKLAEPDLIDVVCAHVTQGGDLTLLCKQWDLAYGHVLNHIRKTPEWSKRLDRAFSDRGEWEKETILGELRRMASVRVSDIFDDNDAIRPTSQWPDHALSAVLGIDVVDYFERDDEGKPVKVGVIKKIKFHPKLDALINLGKELGMFRQKVDIGADKSLESILAEANGK